MKKLSKIFAVVALVAVGLTAVGCDSVVNKLEEQKFDSSNVIVKQNPEVAKELKKPVSSESDMTEVLGDVVKDTYLEIIKSGLPISGLFSRAAAKDAESAAAQTKNFVRKLSDQLEAYAKSKMNNEDGTIDFDGSINIEEITIKDVLQIYVDMYNDNLEAGEAKVTMKSLFGDDIVAYVTALDEVAALDKFKLDVDLLVSDAKKKASIDESVLVAASVGDINKLVSKVSGKTITGIPLKGVSASAKENVSVAVSGQNYTLLMGSGSEDETEVTISAATFDKLKGSVGAKVSMAILTSEKAGGYFTIEANVDFDAEKVVSLLAAEEEGSLQDMITLLDSMVSVSISVSDGKKTTYTSTYNFTQLMALFESITGSISIF